MKPTYKIVAIGWLQDSVLCSSHERSACVSFSLDFSKMSAVPKKLNFDEAVHIVRNGDFVATDDEKLMLYALYKIITVSPLPTFARPILDPIAISKWDAWAEFGKQYNQDSARSLYPQLVNNLRPKSDQSN